MRKRPRICAEISSKIQKCHFPKCTRFHNAKWQNAAHFIIFLCYVRSTTKRNRFTFIERASDSAILPQDQRQRNDGAEIEEKAHLIRRWQCEQRTNVWVRKEGVDYDDQLSGITRSHRVQCYHYWYHYLCDAVYDRLNYTSTRINSSYWWEAKLDTQCELRPWKSTEE